MESKFLESLNEDSKCIIKSLLLDTKLKNYALNWGNNVFAKSHLEISKLLDEIKKNYPQDIKVNTRIVSKKFDIKKCGDIPCIYQLFIQNKNEVQSIIDEYASALSNELEELFKRKENRLEKFQEFINKIRDLGLLQKITTTINENSGNQSNDFFLDLFIPSEIQYEMEKYKNIWLIQGEYKNLKVQIISNKKKQDNLIYEIIGRMETMKQMMGWDFTLDITLLDSKQKRKYREDNIGRREINGGYTWRGSGKIHIFRNQECKKVLLHELIHTFDVDFKKEHDMCESHAELWACIMNCIFTIIESKAELSMNLLGALISFESAFSKIQEKKVYEMIKKDKVSTLAKGYFIYKSLLLENLHLYLNTVGVGKPIFSFPVENNEKYKILINELIRDYTNNFKVPPSLKKNLRMTCVEI